MKIAIVGNNNGPLKFYESLSRSGAEIVYLGLQKEPSDNALKLSYEELNTSIHYGINEDRMLEKLEQFEVDFIINVFCNFIFEKSLEKYTVLNYHLAPLPKYRGRHPLHWGLINGEKEFGSALHLMNEKVDDGAILIQNRVKIPDRCSVQQLRNLLLDNMLVQLPELPDILKKDSRVYFENNVNNSSYVIRRFPEDSQLTEWYEPKKIYNKVWALSSEANPAFIQLNEINYQVVKVEFLSKKFVGIEFPTIYKVDKEHVFIAFPMGSTMKLHIGKHDLSANTRIY